MVLRREILLILPVFMLGMLLWSGQAQSARFTGAYMLKICGVGNDGLEVAPGAHAACQSYISGIVDYHNMLRSMKIAPEVNACVPESVSMNDLHLIVLKYFQDHPEHDSFIAAPAIIMALYEKYPCPGSKRKKAK